ncbi:hypothetical protein BU23DRAFT_568912 [Bimuria novae-zelandiae CBS 107.79]|uniref:F-box domain-containing protein n=1 Tax=Bimuria novae-zelandiae CBS 107.79 TaxID=1447943 RepID=A0A6A5V679_9PLEO|nr:hypothetical protein BU23DRAFT_568912 [Bimuria novae-zelandiae CBS 107.79]
MCLSLRKKNPTAVLNPINLLDLPAELRNHIWRHALCYSTAEIAKLVKSIGWWNPHLIEETAVESWFIKRQASADAVNPALLRACRQINREGTPIFYSIAFIDDVVTGTVLSPDGLEEYIKHLNLMVRPRPHNFKSVFVCLHSDGGRIGLCRSRELRDASIIAHYADVVSRQSGTLDLFHLQMMDWSMNHVFGPNDSMAIPLMRGFGLLHARKVTFGMLGFGIGLCAIAGHCGVAEDELRKMPGKNLISPAGDEPVLGEFIMSWENILEKATIVLRGQQEENAPAKEEHASSFDTDSRQDAMPLNGKNWRKRFVDSSARNAAKIF